MIIAPDYGILEAVTLKLGLKDPVFVEKDYYVTHVIQALSDIQNEHFQLVFIRLRRKTPSFRAGI